MAPSTRSSTPSFTARAPCLSARPTTAPSQAPSESSTSAAAIAAGARHSGAGTSPAIHGITKNDAMPPRMSPTRPAAVRRRPAR